jgi:hypothetical protein
MSAVKFIPLFAVLLAGSAGVSYVSGRDIVSASTTSSASAAAPACSAITAENVDDCVRLNQIQVLGTHNSYHLAPKPAVLEAMGGRGQALEYTHKPLTEQLTQLGIRQFELDVYADPDGGLHARPAAHRIAGDPPVAGMEAPGFKVFHVQDLDVRSTCPTFVACLTEIKTWSTANPRHVPVMIMIEVKDGALQNRPGFEFVKPHPIGAKELDALDAEIRSVFGDDRLITPDSVRGSHATLEAAVRADGWPTLRKARGKVLFALDNTDQHRDDYLQGHPSLKGRVIFVTAPAQDPASAFLKLNDSLDEAHIRERVTAGYLVRTRADEPAREARSGDTTHRDAAFRSGAQYVSTDYPEVSPYGSGYIARLPGAGGLIARCNPVNAPVGCKDEWLEPRPAPRTAQ